MDRFSLLPSVNWNNSRMLAINEAGTKCAYGSRCDIIIVENVHQDSFNEIDGKSILRAHKNSRVTALIFVKHEVDGKEVESLVSCGEDGYVKLWNPETLMMTHKFVMKKVNPNWNLKFVDIDHFPSNSVIVCVTEEKHVVKWDLQKNKVAVYSIEGKERFNCIAACPHEPDLVAIGARLGLVLVYSLRGDGKLKFKVPCHSGDVVSVSWCPVPYNAFAAERLREDPSFNENEWKENDRSLLLASCSKDRTIYICRAGTNGYCEAFFKIPLKTSTNNNNNSRSPTNRAPNYDRGRCIQWIYPRVFLTHTNSNEMIFMKISPKTESKAQMVHNVKIDAKLLAKHQSSINNFVARVTDGPDLNFRVWSSSADKLIVRSGYNVNHKEKPFALPLLSGFVFALDIAPTTFDTLAIGTGDGKVTLWNTSTDDFIDTTTLSNRIVNCKIMCLKWHPFEEGVLAFGTAEGRVGIFDISMGTRSSCVFKGYHHKPIYKLCWGPALTADPESSDTMGKVRSELFLFAVGNGDILQFNPNDINGTPMNLNADILSAIEEKCMSKYKTDMCYEYDREVLVIGFNNGDVCLFSSKTYKFQHVIKDQPKSIMSLVWHPKCVLDSSEECSPYSNWLATAGEHVFVYDVDPNGENAPKKVASLELHTNRVLDVAWSPHVNGRLLSCSADSTVIVWDVISQTIVGRYLKHCAQVLCGVWSLTNKDTVITGSSDFTCRMWSVSKDTTTNSSKEMKITTAKPIEPTIISSPNCSNENAGGASMNASTSVSKNGKPETILPSLTHDIHSCPMLETVVKQAVAARLNKRSDDVSTTDVCLTNGHDSHSLLPLAKLFTKDEELLLNIDQSVREFDDSSCSSWGPTSMNGYPSSSEDSQNKLINQKKKTKHAKPVDSAHNYSKLFSSKEEFLRLVDHEERVLEDTGSKNLFVLVQARHDLKAKITAAMEKNKVTEHMLALAASVSPKLWKDACNVYVEQLIRSEQWMQAVDFLLALNKDEEAIDLLCDKNRFKEAFTIARLRFDDESVCHKVLERWIAFCFNSGLYRLAAHCHLFLKEEERAGTILNKSKNFQDLILAAKLLQFNQRERAVELAADCFKRHLLQITLEDVQDILSTFPEIKFTKIWYMSLKYLRREPANTASVTKWLIGMVSNKDSVILKSVQHVNFEKLQKIIVDNTFDMNFEELSKYVSAQIALYVSGMSDPTLQKTALRHYIRGLYYCDNYRRDHSNQSISDSAYPMMKLLHLTFPKGVMPPMIQAEKLSPDLKVPMKSVNAYFCVFVVTWLMNCDELPHSLKAIERVISDEANEHHSEWMRAFSIINNPKKKLEKINEIMTLYAEDTLGADVAQYLQYKIKVGQYNRGGSPKNEAEEQPKNDSTMIPDDNPNGSTESLTGIKLYREKVADFEKERVAVPNPCLFLCSLRGYVEKHKNVDPPTIANLQAILNEAAVRFGFPKD